MKYFVPHKLLSAHQNKPLSRNATRLQHLALSKLHMLDYLSQAKSVTITSKDWQSVFISSENPYRDIKNGIAGLNDFFIIPRDSREQIKFFERITYLRGAGCVELVFNPKLLNGNMLSVKFKQHKRH